MDTLEIQTKIAVLTAQRNSALDVIVELQGKFAVIEYKYKALLESKEPEDA